MSWMSSSFLRGDMRNGRNIRWCGEKVDGSVTNAIVIRYSNCLYHDFEKRPFIAFIILPHAAVVHECVSAFCPARMLAHHIALF